MQLSFDIPIDLGRFIYDTRKEFGKKLKVFWIDLFCGAGGTTTGIYMSEANAHVVACVNHDRQAIASHKINHPHCHHFVEDITDFKVVLKLKAIVDRLRKEHPGCIINIWASPDCTDHSIAKGGVSREGDSRTLAQHLVMYKKIIGPDYMYIENVKEFLNWGPTRLKEGKNSTVDYCELALNPKKKGGTYIIIPDPEKRKTFYEPWVEEMKSLGYDYDYRLLNVADYEGYTSRLRYFGVFCKSGLPIRFPEPTASRTGADGKQKWKAVREVLDLQQKGVSIFQKKRAEDTYKRILMGLKKNVAKADYFLTGYYGNGLSHSIDTVCNTLTTKDRYALHYIQYEYGNAFTTAIDNPANTITNVPKHNLLSVEWLTDTQYNRTGMSLDQPCWTIIARQDKKPLYLLQAERGYPADFIQDDDLEIVKEIKQFMIEHCIKNIYIRMLNEKELLRIQGFPEDYVLLGNVDERKKFIGNSVAPLMAKALIEENYYALEEHFKNAA
jgi:DNA (cytosine-5)-methyltransferase 1